jgi:uncharacterized membrane protein YheB (UPF0754 family)
MINFLLRYIEKHFQFEEIFELPAPSESKRKRPAAPRLRTWLLNFLKFVPWLCAGGFVASLIVDFTDHDYIWLFGYRFPLENILLTVSISGLIGYATNYIAIRMLFRPRERRPIWGQGLIPAHKDRIADKMANTINKNILNEEQIKEQIHQAGIVQRLNEKLINGTQSLLQDEAFQAELKQILYDWLVAYFNNPANRERIVSELDRKIDEAAAGPGVGKVMVRSYRSLYRRGYEQNLDRAVQNLPDSIIQIMDEYDTFATGIQTSLVANADEVEAKIAHAIQNVIDRIQIYRILRHQLDRFDEGKLEDMIWSATNEHLLYIQYLGGLLGMLGGLILWQPELMLIVYGTLGGGLFVLDQVLFRLRKSQT